ncbi:MAG TPA: Sua5/YciO/YrdC/YwlC family protein [Burkholderiales bacterium]|nr:Sua5/YciO/YrdC/YwlC family protein [Burkholderiales bacterium]
MAAPMPGRDVEADARRVYDCVVDGGIAIIHLDVAYAVLAHTADAVRRFYEAKRRSYNKPTGILGNHRLHEELHLLSDQQREMVRTITRDYDLPLAVIAPFRKNHPLIARMDPFVATQAVKGDTLNILLNAGTLRTAIADLAIGNGKLFVGTSANTSLAGSRYRLDDIEPDVRSIADLEIDYGPSKYANPLGLSSTMIDFSTYRVQRAGVCFEEISNVMERRFGITLHK